MPMQIRRTNGSGPPSGLAEGQLSVEMDTRNLWVGVPTSIDPSGRVQVNDMSGYLRLSGGTMNTVTAAGMGLTIGVSGAGNNRALDLTNSNTSTASQALRITNTGQYGVTIVSSAVTTAAAMDVQHSVGRVFLGSRQGGGTGIYLNGSNPTSPVLEVWRWTPDTTRRLAMFGDGSMLINCGTDAATALSVTASGAGATALAVSGAPLRVGTPTGPAVTGPGNVNVSGGYYVNGNPLLDDGEYV